METVSQMLKSSPDHSITNATDVLTACIRACLECEQACVSCADTCLGDKHVDTLRRCIRLCLDCSDVCSSACRMVSRQYESDHEMVRRQLQLLAAACHACADECERHKDMACCRICMDCCRQCEQTCASLLQALSAPSSSHAH